jgi:hypothetical protein
MLVYTYTQVSAGRHFHYTQNSIQIFKPPPFYIPYSNQADLPVLYLQFVHHRRQQLYFCCHRSRGHIPWGCHPLVDTCPNGTRHAISSTTATVTQITRRGCRWTVPRPSGCPNNPGDILILAGWTGRFLVTPATCDYNTVSSSKVYGK